jgi:hypothetical protein
VVFAFDPADSRSLGYVRQMVEVVSEHAPAGIVQVLLGTKSDLGLRE